MNLPPESTAPCARLNFNLRPPTSRNYEARRINPSSKWVAIFLCDSLTNFPRPNWHI